eukprot:scaffold1364_cov133-Skeletonema_menzelii.AAC.2
MVRRGERWRVQELVVITWSRQEVNDNNTEMEQGITKSHENKIRRLHLSSLRFLGKMSIVDDVPHIPKQLTSSL